MSVFAQSMCIGSLSPIPARVLIGIRIRKITGGIEQHYFPRTYVHLDLIVKVIKDSRLHLQIYFKTNETYKQTELQCRNFTREHGIGKWCHYYVSQDLCSPTPLIVCSPGT